MEGEGEETVTSTSSSSSSSYDIGPGGYPGDGVCPSVSSLEAAFKTAYDTWAMPARQTGSDGRDDLFDLNMFLQLMSEVPPFRPPPLKQAVVPETIVLDLFVSLDMLLETCMIPDCNQREKRIPSQLLIGCSSWQTYETVCPEDQEEVSRLGLPLPSLQYITRLVLAWSYVLSCRWADTLRASGETAAVLQPEIGTASDFWGMIREERWQATVEHQGKDYYSPFMLRSSQTPGLNIEHPSIAEPEVQVAQAFQFIREYCMAHNQLHECVIALVIVFSLILSDRPCPKLLAWSSGVESTNTEPCGSDEFTRIWDILDQCITIGCTLGAVDSLLCSAFFDPAVPCNAVGAQLMGVRSALKIESQRYDHLIHALKEKRPAIAALWLGVISTGQAERMLQVAMSAIPPVDLVVGTWTGVVQSFLQVQYDDTSLAANQISRASEYSTAFYVQPDVNRPLCRFPPFGRALTENTGLQVREHLQHCHRPWKARFYWRLNNGQTAQFHIVRSVACPIVHLWQPEAHDASPISSTANWSDAMQISSTATSYIFSWHCQNEGGLWLDEGNGSEAARKIQTHPWIDTSLFDETESEGQEEEEEQEEEEHTTKIPPGFDSIRLWQLAVLEGGSE